MLRPSHVPRSLSPPLPWHPASNTSASLYAIWGTDANNLYAVGDNGTIINWNGSSWSTMSSGTDYRLEAIWGWNTSNIYAGGVEGTVLYFDGSSWEPIMGVSRYADVVDILGFSATDVRFATRQPFSAIYRLIP